MPKAVVISIGPGLISAILIAIYPDGKIPFLAEQTILSETQAWNGFSFFVGFLLVFRTTQAYNRFWDACEAVLRMRAEWFDAATGLIAFSKDSEGQPFDIIRGWQEETVMMVCCMHATALIELRGGESGTIDMPDIIAEPTAVEKNTISSDTKNEESPVNNRNHNVFMFTPDQVCELHHFDQETQDILVECNAHDRVCLFFEWVQNHIVLGHSLDIIDISPPILSRTFQQLSGGMVAFYQALKISQVPFPFPYAQVCDLLLIIHWSLIPFVMTQWTTHWLWSGIFATIQVLVLWSLNLIALEIENPFGTDENDIDLEQYQADLSPALKPF